MLTQSSPAANRRNKSRPSQVPLKPTLVKAIHAISTSHPEEIQP